MTLNFEYPDVMLNVIELYPNPTYETISIKVAFAIGASLKLYDLVGKQILQQDSNPEEIKQGVILDLKAIREGLFFLSIITETEMRVMKVVKY